METSGIRFQIWSPRPRTEHEAHVESAVMLMDRRGNLLGVRFIGLLLLRFAPGAGVASLVVLLRRALMLQTPVKSSMYFFRIQQQFPEIYRKVMEAPRLVSPTPGSDEAAPAPRTADAKLFILLELYVSSLRRGHANILRTPQNVTDDPRRESPEDRRCAAPPRPASRRTACALVADKWVNTNGAAAKVMNFNILF